MWARVIESNLACWLAISPFLFRHAPDAVLLWTNDLVCAGLLASLALLSFHHRLRRVHLLILPLAMWLLGVGLVRAYGAPDAASQNYIVLGLLLGMLAIVPSRASEPPPGWANVIDGGKVHEPHAR
jgi:hypothetical protein